MSEDTSMGDSRDINTAILERLEKVVESLQENSIQMGKLLAVHNEKLDKQDRIDAVLFEKVESLHREVNRSTIDIKKGCERDIRLIDERLRLMEKKMWSIFGGLAIISFLVSPVGQRILKPLSESSQSRLTHTIGSGIIGSVVMSPSEFS
jgi:gamma-glutamyl phosphate reductase